MNLRVLTVLAVLGLYPVMGALEGLVHLCKGRPTLKASCCCPRGKAAPSSHEGELLHRQARCCTLRASRPAPAPAAMVAAERPWQLEQAVALLPPQVPHLRPPLTEVPQPLAWGRTAGLSRATAPPLYLQLRMLLL
jgi:hypothetical protein